MEEFDDKSHHGPQRVQDDKDGNKVWIQDSTHVHVHVDTGL